MHKGTLYLVPTVLQENALHVIPAYVHDITRSITVFFVEDERTTRRYLRKTGFSRSFDEITILRIQQESEMSDYLHYLLDGMDAALLSEAGVPAIADPGSVLVRMAHEAGIKVVPLTGPSSIILSLMASGLNGQQFEFLGYLPVKSHERKAVLKQLNQKISLTGTTQIFIETPYRNNGLIQDVLDVCNSNLRFCIAANLTADNEFIRTYTIAHWKQHPVQLEKIPAIFLLGN